MCFEVVSAYGLALMAMISSPQHSGLEFVMDEPTRSYAAELFVRGCIWRETHEEYDAKNQEQETARRERMLWYWSNQ